MKNFENLRKVGAKAVITTQYMDRHHEYLRIHATRTHTGFVLTDAGHVLDDLESTGYDPDSEDQEAILQTTISGYGVSVNGNALEVEASVDNFAVRKHNLVQAMLAVHDAFASS